MKVLFHIVSCLFLSTTVVVSKKLSSGMDEHNDTRTRLMTLLNVSHLRATKRKLALSSESAPASVPEKRLKLNQKRKQIISTANGGGPSIPVAEEVNSDGGQEPTKPIGLSFLYRVHFSS